MIGMAIRMGGDAQGFGNDPGIPEFLSAGDELRFVRCARQLAAARVLPPEIPIRYVLVSDSPAVVSAVKAELGDALVERALWEPSGVRLLLRGLNAFVAFVQPLAACVLKRFLAKALDRQAF